MLTELSLTNYRCHTETRFPLGPLNVLVGPNAIGKSSALEALWLLGQLLDSPATEVLTGAKDLRWLARRGGGDIEIRVRGADGGEEWELGAAQRNRNVGLDWGRVGSAEERALLDGIPFKPGRGERPQGANVLKSAATFRFDARRLAEPSHVAEEEPHLHEDGYGLATVLSTLKLMATRRFSDLEDTARTIIPSLRRIHFKRTKVDQQSPRALMVEGQRVVLQERETVIADELLLDTSDAEGLPAHAASEGTLIVLGILAALSSSSAPSLLLLEDIEHALHPKAQRDLVLGLRSALAAAPGAQIVATTHSPYLVDALEPSEVIVLGRTVEGKVAARLLAEHPKANLLSVLTGGELWTAEGESWVSPT